jgi:hypothetical protein
MPRVVVAGSENDTSFAVVDFTNPASPHVVLVNAMFGAGCRVAIGGAHAAVASVLTGEFKVVDVTNPAAPVVQGSVMTTLAGAGALAVRGSLVAVGEQAANFQARVCLIDISNPSAPAVLGYAPTAYISNGTGSAAIGSVAFVGDHVVAVSGTDPQITQIDFTNPGSPVVTTFLPMMSLPVIDADADNDLLVAGDSTSGIVKWFHAGSHALIGTLNTMFGGVTSVSASSPRALVGSTNELNCDLIDIVGPVQTTFNPNLGGGSFTAISGTTGACGSVLGSQVALVDVSGAPAVLGTANVTIASVSTVAISTIAGGGPVASVSPAMLAFGTVHVGTGAMLPVTIHNTGTGTLTVNGLNSSDPRFTFAPPGPFTIAGGGMQPVNVTFTPTAEAPFSGTLTMHTSDPAHATLNVALSGAGGLPHIVVTPPSLNLGSVAICLSGAAPVNIHNSGGVPLSVTSVQTTGAPFGVAPASLTVAAGATSNANVTFTPSFLGPANGTLTIASNDLAHPTVTVALSGTGETTPPPAIAVTPPALSFGATPVQFYIGLRITVANASPCQPLTVTLTSNGAPFFVTDTDPTTLPPMSLSVGPFMIAGGGSKGFVVAFAPQTTGMANGTLTIASNDPAHPTTVVPLSGNGVQLNPTSIELVLDRSGSMAAPAQGGTKMDGLKAAVQLFADLVIPGQGDEMGSVQFDDAFNVLTPFGAFDTAKQSAIVSDANTLTPRNFTSIGGGLQLGQTQVTTGMTPRKVILVFTDGMQNHPPPIAIAPIVAAGTEVYAVALGQPQNISVADLSTLAASSNGHFFLTDDTLVLRKNFVQVLADAFRQNMAADPVFTIHAGEQLEFPVEITQCERRITFVLNWDDPASQVGLTVVAPDHTTFTPNSPLSNQLVRYGERPGYRYYQIAFPPLDPGSGKTIGPAQIGTWRMIVRGTALAKPAERCATSVLVESQLELRAIVHATDPSQPIDVSAFILDAGTVVTDAAVRVTVTAPQKSLAAVSTPAVVHAALDADHHPIPAGKQPLIPLAKTTHALERNDKQRGFTLTLPPPRFDGVYGFEFEAKGKACGGIFDRYQTFSVYIGKRADSKTTTFAVRALSPNAALVTVTPHDAAGAPLGPGLGAAISAELANGVVYPAIDLHDGSYVIRVLHPHDVRPLALRVNVGGESFDVSLTPNRS